MVNENDLNRARQLVASCWCSDTTQNIVMIPELAEEFAKLTAKLIDNIEMAWGLIANSDWEERSEDWQRAATKWRDEVWNPLCEMKVF